MVQLVWLQGHKYTAPPSVMSGWLVLAFGAPTKTLMLGLEKTKEMLTYCGEELSAREVQEVNISAVPKVRKKKTLVNVTSN